MVLDYELATIHSSEIYLSNGIVTVALTITLFS